MLAAFLSTILFSVSVVCGHRSAKLIGGTEANFWRLSFAAVLLGYWAYTFGIGLNGAAFPLFLLSGVVGIGIGDVALFQALPRLGSRLSMLLIQCLTPPLGALLEWLWLGTTLTPRQITGGTITLLGVGLALAPGGRQHRTRAELTSGTFFSLVAALGGGFGAVLSRRAYAIAQSAGQRIDGANAAFQRIMGGLLVAGICLLIAKRRELRIQATAPQRLMFEASWKKWRSVWPWVLMNGLAGQTIGVSFMQWALETTPTGVVLAIIAMTPIVVIPFALLMENERPTPHSLAGGAIAVAGVVALTL
jgi:drug/metabolite transporter (DMT)-like permease